MVGPDRIVQPDRSGAAEFEDEDVVASYVHRPDYSTALCKRLLDLMPRRGRLLDLGCGPGKIARALAPYVDEVLAIDPSAVMLRLGVVLDAGANQNIRWRRASGEELEPKPASIDLTVAGASVQWMDPFTLFPRLVRASAFGAPVVIVDGDAPTDAPWIDAYQRVIRSWVERLGGVWNGDAHRALTTAHARWLDIQGEETFAAPVRQPLESLITSEHSRATWSRARMGVLAGAFDADLRAALGGWAKGGLLTYEVRTSLTWGWPCATIRPC